MKASPSNYNSKIVKLPYRGAPTTVGVLRDSILDAQNDYAVRELAEEICVGVQAKDYVSEPLAIFYYVSTHVRYMRDPRTVELVRDPAKLVAQLHDGIRPSGDCDDLTALIGALCMSAGCQVRICTVAFKHMFYQSERQYSHVFIQAKDPRSGEWITLDPVAGKRTKEMLNRVVAATTWAVE